MLNPRKLIKTLKEDVEFWKQAYKRCNEETNEFRRSINELKQKINQKDKEIADLNHIKEENEILKKYFHLDEEPSAEVQAKVLVDLRLHDMEYEYLKSKLRELDLLRIQGMRIPYNIDFALMHQSPPYSN